MSGRNFLFVPGPTNVPDRVLRAMHRAMEDHRSSAFPALPLSIFPDLQRVFGTTTGQPFVFPATGTGMWEAADRKSTRLNSSHANISYAVFCLKKKKHEP